MDFTTITQKQLEEYELMRGFINALRSGGVDNWEWFSESLEDAGWYKKAEEFEEKWNEIVIF